MAKEFKARFFASLSMTARAYFSLSPIFSHLLFVGMHAPQLGRWTARKLEEKLNCLHSNPVKRGWVKEPGDWPWSSWRYYFKQDASLLAMDRVP